MSKQTKKEKKVYCKKGTRKNPKTGICEGPNIDENNDKPSSFQGLVKPIKSAIDQIKEAAFSFRPTVIENSKKILQKEQIKPIVQVLECSKKYVFTDGDLPRKEELDKLSGPKLRKIHFELTQDPAVIDRTPGVKTKDELIRLIICLENNKKFEKSSPPVENFEGFSEPRSGIEKPRSSRDVTDLRSVKSPEDEEEKTADFPEAPVHEHEGPLREPLPEPNLDQETKIDIGLEREPVSLEEPASLEEPVSLEEVAPSVVEPVPVEEINDSERGFADKIGIPPANPESKEYNTFLFEKEKLERENLQELKDGDSLGFLYPELNDPNFNIKIAKRKEFNDTQYDGTIYDIKEQANKLCNTDFELMPHQLFVKNFMSMQTPYNCLLLFMGLGTGKSCSSIGIAEETRAYMKQVGLTQPIFIIASPNVQQNYRLQLFDERKLKLVNGLWTLNTCIGNSLLQEINPTNLTGIPKDRIISEINTIINKYYVFMGYTELANYIRRHSDIPQGSRFSLADQKSLRIKKIRKYFDNRLIIIDEAHNIRISDDNKEDAKTASLLMEVARYANNVRLLLLSATPMYNNYKEIVWLTNLMNMVDKRATINESDVFDKEGGFLTERSSKDGKKIEGGRELLQRKLTGYISHVRGENPYTFPLRIYPDSFSPENAFASLSKYPSQQLNGKTIEEPLKHSPVFISPIGEYQAKGYDFVMNHLRNKSFSTTNKFGEVRELPTFDNMDSFGYILLMQPLEALNIVFPHPEIKAGETVGFPAGEGELYPEEKNEEIIKNMVGKRGLYRIMSRKEDKGTIPNIYDFEYKAGSENIFQSQNIGKYSGKIAKIVESVRNSTGIVLIYTQYIEGGVVPVALALEEMGFGRFSVASHAKSLFKEAPIEPLDALTMKSKSTFLEEGGEPAQFQQAKYIMVTGNKAFSPDNLADIKYATNPNNKNGEKVKVIIISKAGSEGLDFKWIRQVHVLEPWYNMSRIEQIIGRGVRNLSHCGLDFEKRNVEIYLHATLPTGDEEPADLYVYRFAEKKAEQIGRVTRLLKEVAVDCILNVGQSNLTVDKLNALAQNRDIKIQLSSKGNELVPFSIGDKPFSAVCDYMDNCAFTCSPTSAISESDIIQDTYNNDFLKMTYGGIIKRIRDLFRERTVYSRDELITSINIIKTYPTSHIDYALSRFIDNKSEYVYDRWGRTGYLVNKDQYYTFQPIEITDESISLFERTLPVDHKREYVEIELPKEKAPLLVEEPMDQPIVVNETEKTMSEHYDVIIKQLDAAIETVKTWRNKKLEGARLSSGESDWYMNAGFVFDTIIANHGIAESDLMEFVTNHFLDTLPTNDRFTLVKYLFSMGEGEPVLEYQSEIRSYFTPKIVTVRRFKCLVLISDKLVESSDERFKIYIQDDDTDKTVWNVALPTDRIAALKAIIPTMIVQPANMNRLVGFMQVFRNDDVVFKTMDMQNKLKKGSRCGGEGKKDIMKKINLLSEYQYTEENTEDTELGKNLILKQGLCIILETLLRHLNHRRFEMGHEVSQISNFEVDLSEDVTGPVPLQIFKGINKGSREGMVWFMDLERAVLSKLVK